MRAVTSPNVADMTRCIPIRDEADEDLGLVQGIGEGSVGRRSGYSRWYPDRGPDANIAASDIAIVILVTTLAAAREIAPASRLSSDKFGSKTACLRIVSSFPEPRDRRHLWCHPSVDNCVRLVEAPLIASRVGRTISFGVSDNKVRTVHNSGADHLGFLLRDNGEPFRAVVEAKTSSSDPKAPATRYLGGFLIDAACSAPPRRIAGVSWRKGPASPASARADGDPVPSASLTRPAAGRP